MSGDFMDEVTGRGSHGTYHKHCNDVTVINGQCMVGQGIGFERTRRITGYLVGTLLRFNDAKRAEEKDRVKHGIQNG